MREGPDLFGEIPVTWCEVRAWCRRVAGIEDVDGARGRHYVRAWAVVDKIRAAKEHGQWSDSLAHAARADNNDSERPG